MSRCLNQLISVVNHTIQGYPIGTGEKYYQLVSMKTASVMNIVKTKWYDIKSQQNMYDMHKFRCILLFHRLKAISKHSDN